MDDVLILAKTRWKLRKAVAVVNGELDKLKLEKHPDKTIIGRIDKGFDFLGYHINATTLHPATTTVQKYWANISRLYEQGVSQKRIEQYRRRWMGWCTGKLGDYMSPSGVNAAHALLYGPVQNVGPGSVSIST